MSSSMSANEPHTCKLTKKMTLTRKAKHKLLKSGRNKSHNLPGTGWGARHKREGVKRQSMP